MFKLFEVYFDLIYLSLMFGIGLRTLLEKGKSRKLLAAMATLLAAGDACHLLPRVYAHLSPGGLATYTYYLSYGQMITGLTMSVFYLLFLFYYQEKGGKITRMRRYMFFALFGLRILFVLLPNNNWGGESPYCMALLRNAPFLLMGIALIIWMQQEQNLPTMRQSSLFIGGSFLFYALVVLFVPFIPSFGAFMMPKTVCYILLIFGLYKEEAGNFNRYSFLKASLTCLELGLILGVFYREFTKLFCYQSTNKLVLGHPHMLILGFAFFFLLYLLATIEKLDVKYIKKSYVVYILGLAYFIASILLRGIYQVAAQGQTVYSDSAIAGFAGIGHVVLGVGLISICMAVLKSLRVKDSIRPFKAK